MSEIDIIELKRALSGLAELTRTFYTELQEQGFSDAEALRLTVTWLRATSGSAKDD